MKVALLVSFLLLLISSCNCCSRNSDSDNCNFPMVGATNEDEDALKGKLVFVHILFRHGDRTPEFPYPNDPWRNVSFWPTGWGQLTNIGKREQLQLGQWLRQRYDSLLSQTYSRDEIYVRSTDVDRTLMSALCVLAGLYPPQASDVWNESINWQPIPVHTTPEKMDHVLAAKQNCPAHNMAMSNLLNSAEFQNIKNRYKFLFDYLTENSGRKVKTFFDILSMNNTFYIEELYNKTLPLWVKKVYPSEDMSFLADLAFALNTYTRQLARLNTGSLIKEILERCKDKSKRVLKPNRSVWIYSAHDTTVASVLNTLKMFEYHSPPYSACLMFELRIDESNQPLLSIFYKNTSDEPRLMRIPGCGVACPLEKMSDLYKDIIPGDWITECMVSSIKQAYYEADEGNSFGILIIILPVILVLSYFAGVYYCKKKSYKEYQVA